MENESKLLSEDISDIEAFLQEEVEKECENGYYQIRSECRYIPKDFLLQTFQEYAENNHGFENFECYLECQFYQYYEFIAREEEFKNIIMSDASDRGQDFVERLKEYLQSFDNRPEPFEKAGYQGISYNFEALLEHDYNLNIFLSKEMKISYEIPDNSVTELMVSISGSGREILVILDRIANKEVKI